MSTSILESRTPDVIWRTPTGYKLIFCKLATPTASEEQEGWRSVFESFGKFCTNIADVCAAEKLVASHLRLVHVIARNMLDEFKPASLGTKKVLRTRLTREECFSAGLMGLWTGLRGARKSIRGESDQDTVTQLGKYVGVSCKRAILRYARQMSTVEKAMDEIVETTVDQRPLPEDLAFPVDVYQQVGEALRGALQLPSDESICRLKCERRLSNAEIGEQVGMTAKQVQRRLLRVQKAVEKALGLPHSPPRARKTRSNRDPGVVWDLIVASGRVAG